MPTYDYECDACGNKFEHFQSIKDPVLTKCPKCKKKKLRRLFGTGAAIMFKGSGFYITDYRSDSYKQGAQAAEKSKSEAKSDSSKSESSKADNSKSETKSSDTSSKSDSGSKSSGSSEKSSASKSSGKSSGKKK